LKEGRLIEQGSHEELLRRRGFYYSLYHGGLDAANEEADA